MIELESPAGKYSVLEFPEIKPMSKNHYRYKLKYPFPYISELIELRYPDSDLVFKIRGSLFQIKGYRDLDKDRVKEKLLKSFEGMNLLYDFVRSLDYWSNKNEYSLELPPSLGDKVDICKNKVIVTWFKSDTPESDRETLYIPILDI